ncbi:MAG TPA: DUF1707 domain-containing protein [Solirubrobacteraceae bacterium]|jgi:hypothetical protein|nr:DUF1707 domain-containing protein [Solirubrobacteraceae bacterium]
MSTSANHPAHLASEDIIISAPMSYAGSAQRIMRLRRRAGSGGSLVALTTAALVLIVFAWVMVTAWYLIWGIWLVPYRLVRRGARKRKVEALRHRELLGTIQGSAAASAATIVAAKTAELIPALLPSDELVADADRDLTVDELRGHLMSGRLTSEEFEERVSAAQKARTRADLDAATIHLPHSPR